MRRLTIYALSLLLVLSSFGLSFAADTFEMSYVVNSGGLNTKASHFALKDNETSNCLNVYFGTDGSIKKRKGYIKVADTAMTNTPDVTGIKQVTFSTGTTYLIGTGGTKIFKSDSLTTVSWDDITGAATVTADNYFDIEMFLDTVILTNGEDVPLKWTGAGNVSALTVPTNLTEAKWVTQIKNYLLLANITLSTTRHPSRVYWYNLKSVSAVTDTHFTDISPNDGEEIEGIEILGDRAVVYKKTKVFLLVPTGDSTIPFVVYHCPAGIGTVSGHTIKLVENVHLYLYYDGIYAFDGNYSKKISTKIDPTIDGFNKVKFSSTCAEVYKKLNQYYIAFTTSGGGSNDKVIVYDWFNDAFSPYDGMAISAFTTVITAGEERLYFGDYDGDTFRLDYGYNDNGSAITSYYWTKWFDFGTAHKIKRVKHMQVHMATPGAYTLTVGYNYNHQEGVWKQKNLSMDGGGSIVGTAVVGTATCGTASGTVDRVDLTGAGFTFRAKFSNNMKDQYFDIRGYTLAGSILGIR